MAETWYNNDGLFIRFGTEEAKKTKVGEYGDYDPGSIHLVQVRLDYTDMTALAKTVHRAVRLPGANSQTCFLKKAEVFIEEAFDSAGNAFTLEIGLDEVDGDIFDADGIDTAIAETAIDAVGDTVVCDGARINTRLANTVPLHITTTVGGAVPTAGKGWLRVWFYIQNV